MAIRKLKLLTVLLAISFLSACSTQPIKIVSYPDGAKIKTNSGSCTAPCELRIDSSTEYMTATLPDGRSKTVNLDEHFSQGSLAGKFFYQTGEAIKFTSAGLALIGLGTTSLLLGNMESENRADENHTNDYNSALFTVSLVAWTSSFLLMTAGDETKKLSSDNGRTDIDFGYFPEDDK